MKTKSLTRKTDNKKKERDTRAEGRYSHLSGKGTGNQNTEEKKKKKEKKRPKRRSKGKIGKSGTSRY